MARAAPPVLTARSQGLVGCRRCFRAWPINTRRCLSCGEPLTSRDPLSMQRVWAWWIAGVMCYIPANLWPMLETKTLFYSQSDTIVAGAIDLYVSGARGVAAIILVASVVIPIAKFMAIAYLVRSVNHHRAPPSMHRQHLYEIVEYIGRWSMIDVFVVAILASLVQISGVVEITPGPASLTFALSVIFTMLSAQSFDSRMLWDSFEPVRDIEVDD